MNWLYKIASQAFEDELNKLWGSQGLSLPNKSHRSIDPRPDSTYESGNQTNAYDPTETEDKSSHPI